LFLYANRCFGLVALAEAPRILPPPADATLPVVGHVIDCESNASFPSSLSVVTES